MPSAMPLVRLLIAGVDETAYLLADVGVSIVRGRSDAESAVSPGRATLALDNSSGRFTLGRPNAAGASRVSGQSLVVEVWDGTAWAPRFTGTVDSWPVAWDASGAAVVTVSASDGLKRLALLCDGRTVGDPPSEYQRLRQLPGVTTVQWAPGTPLPSGVGMTGSPLVRRAWAWREAVPAYFNPSSLASGCESLQWGSVFDGETTVDFAGAAIPVATMRGATDWVICRGPSVGVAFGAVRVGAAWVRADVATDALWVGGGDYGWGSVAPGVLRVRVVGGGWLGPLLAVTPGRWHHLAIAVDGTVSPVSIGFWADGALVCSTMAGAAPDVSMEVRAESLTSGAGSVAVADQVQVGCSDDPSLIPTVVAGLYGAGAGLTERTDQRVERVLRRIGLWDHPGALDVGRATMTPTTPGAAMAAATAIQDAVSAEGGTLFATVDGQLRFCSATSRWGSPVELALTADQASADLRLDTDGESGVANAVIATNGLDSLRLDDAASQAVYGLRETSLAVQAAESSLRQLASEALARRRWEGLRVAQLTLDLLTQPDIRHDALGLDIGSPICVSSLPAGADATEVSAFVEGWTETIRADEWTLAVNTSTGMLGTAGAFGGAQFDLCRFGF